MQEGQTVRVISGKYAGAVGWVVEVKQMAKVRISGVVNGAEVNGDFWLNVGQLEAC